MVDKWEWIAAIAATAIGGYLVYWYTQQNGSGSNQTTQTSQNTSSTGSASSTSINPGVVSPPSILSSGSSSNTSSQTGVQIPALTATPAAVIVGGTVIFQIAGMTPNGSYNLYSSGQPFTAEHSLDSTGSATMNYVVTNISPLYTLISSASSDMVQVYAVDNNKITTNVVAVSLVATSTSGQSGSTTSQTNTETQQIQINFDGSNIMVYPIGAGYVGAGMYQTVGEAQGWADALLITSAASYQQYASEGAF